MLVKSAIPILRMFDVDRARAFYVDYLGFTVEWEHRFEPELPLYMQVSRDGCCLHLSEHHGDCCPGAAVRIGVGDIDDLHAELAAKPYRFARPGIALKTWGLREIDTVDPAGNRIIFFELKAPDR